MVKLFVAYGNYENRAKARTRYMQDVLGDKYVEAYQEKLAEAMREEKLEVKTEPLVVTKKSDGTQTDDKRAVPQKQEGLYAVEYHPIGGCPAPGKLKELYEAMKDMEQAEIRIAPDEKLYVINLTGAEAKKILEITKDSAKTVFEASVACIGASICQVGLRDSQKLLAELVAASREWGYEDGVLPKLYISGCPSSCGTHQIGRIGLRGAVKKVEGKQQPAFVLTVNGNDKEGKERFGEQLGTITETEIPVFLKELGKEISDVGMKFEQWYENHADRLKEIAEPYVGV